MAITEQERATETTAPSRAMSARNRWLLGIGLSALSGLFAVWALEDFHVEFLAFVAFVPAIVATHRVLPKRWSGLGLAIAIGMMFQGYLGPGLNNADLAWYFYVFGLWIGLIVLALAWRSRGFQERTNYRYFIVSAPVAFVALEFLRSTQSETFAGTWGNISYALFERPALLQPIRITGIWGITLLVLVVNWAIAGVVIALLDRRAAPMDGAPVMAWKRARTGAAIIAAVLAVWTIAGMFMMSTPPATLRVAAIQPGAYTNDRTDWQSLTDEQELANDIQQTKYAASMGAKLVVWREGGLGMDLRESKINAPIRKLAKQEKVYIAAGWGGTYDKLRLNEVATFSPQGKFLGTYGKSHPGTFAGDFSDRRSDYIVYKTPFGGVGSIICYDLDYTDSARAVAKRGANVLAVSSNDVPGITEKHYAHLVFRSIETNLPTVKADGQFDSAIIDPFGRIEDRHLSKNGSRATLVNDIPVGSGNTPYVRFGDWLGWLCVGRLVIYLFHGLTTRLKGRRS